MSALPETASVLLLRSLVCAAFFTAAPLSHAASPELTYHYTHHLFALRPDDYPQWRRLEEVWTYEGRNISPPAQFRVDGDALPPLPTGFERHVRRGWDHQAIERTLQEQIARILDRVPGSVTITRTGTGMIVFHGIGMLGRRVDIEEAASLTVQALHRSITEIMLPVEETQPLITVNDVALRSQGVREVVSMGESDFRGSPAARTHNIRVGLGKLNGVLIPQGETFSFNNALGKIDAAAGYRKELVIQGPYTLPDYGGGLCQISTTAYRGVWEYGFPIAARKNHSFAVRYYSPVGTDATIFPPWIDVRFVNDSPGDLLIQTHEEDGRAYFIFYGTRDARETQTLGPFTWDFVDPPEDREEFTTEIPPPEKRTVSERVPGLKVVWYRTVRRLANGDERTEEVFSGYEARGFLTQIGAPPMWLPPQRP